jgi:hypothetical protein
MINETVTWTNMPMHQEFKSFFMRNVISVKSVIDTYIYKTNLVSCRTCLVCSIYDIYL